MNKRENFKHRPWCCFRLEQLPYIRRNKLIGKIPGSYVKLMITSVDFFFPVYIPNTSRLCRGLLHHKKANRAALIRSHDNVQKKSFYLYNELLPHYITRPMNPKCFPDMLQTHWVTAVPKAEDPTDPNSLTHANTLRNIYRHIQWYITRLNILNTDKQFFFLYDKGVQISTNYIIQTMPDLI